jgi:hypothetical protein
VATYWTSQTFAPVNPVDPQYGFARFKLPWPVANQFASTGAW